VDPPGGQGLQGRGLHGLPGGLPPGLPGLPGLKGLNGLKGLKCLSEESSCPCTPQYSESARIQTRVLMVAERSLKAVCREFTLERDLSRHWECRESSHWI